MARTGHGGCPDDGGSFYVLPRWGPARLYSRGMSDHGGPYGSAPGEAEPQAAGPYDAPPPSPYGQPPAAPYGAPPAGPSASGYGPYAPPPPPPVQAGYGGYPPPPAGQPSYAPTTPPAPPGAAAYPPPAKQEGQIPIWVLGVVGAVLLAMIATTAFLLLKPLGKKEEAGPSYPDVWDSRVLPYVKIAQRKRDLTFTHPVEVVFLPKDEFEKTVTTEEKELSDEERTQIEQYTGLFRALGLISGDVDLFGANNEAQGAGTLAYYSFEDERIVVRGEKIRPAVRATLVHELTHVLQDQNFNIGDTMTRLEADPASSTEADVLRAIAEGDAERVAAFYRDSLSAKERAKLDNGRDQEIDEADPRLKDVPPILLTLLGAPYTLGSALVAAADADGGNDAVDDLFTDPPKHDSVLVRPLKELTGDVEFRDLKKPKIDKGDKAFEGGELGAFTWYLMLAERLPAKEALRAVDGWAGDSFVAYDDGGTSCVRATYAGGTRAQTEAMLASLKRWDAAEPGSSASVHRRDGLVDFKSCDPGTEADAGPDTSQEAVGLLMTRAFLAIGMIRSGATPELGECVADRLIDVYPVKSLNDPTFGSKDPSVKSRIQQIAASCRA